jgi:hypothetical protein
MKLQHCCVVRLVRSTIYRFSDRGIEDSPLQSNQSMYASSLEKGSSDSAPMSIDGLLAQGIPVEVLMRTLAGQQSPPNPRAPLLTATEHPTISLADLAKSLTNIYGQSHQAMEYCTAQQPTYTFSPQTTEPNLNLVDIDELSAGLGLPSANKDPRTKGSPVNNHRPRPFRSVEKALYGKLIDRALNKPLTADALAHYMKSRSESSEETVKPSQDQPDPFVDYNVPTQEQPQALRVVRAPPGFGMQTSRMVTVEDAQIPTGPAIMQQKIAQAGPSGYFHQHSIQTQTGTPFQRHSRHSSIRKRPRGYTRTKRTDQGPEPSAADIYPDDAHFTPTQQPFRHNYFSPPTHITPCPVVQLEDPVSWPTPAEVFTNKVQVAPPAPAHVPQLFTPREVHVSPTLQDVHAADRDVHSLLHELPEPSINTLITFNAYEFVGDERSLSPDQSSGKRYGVNFFGIGLGDEWGPPRKEEWGQSTRYRSEPFRVRPRAHEGWGGWEWAIGKSWGEE